MTFKENNYKKEFYLKLKNLYIEKKYKEIIKVAPKYLEKYPYDINIRFMYSKALRYEERYEEAIENLKINLKYKPNDPHSLVFLYYTYYFLNMYKEAYNLLPQIYESDTIRKQSLYITKLIMRKSLGMTCSLNEFEKDNYVKKQIVDYDKELALKHINEHTTPSEEQELNGKEKTQFNDIDLEYLMEIVKENIKGVKKANIEEILDVYYFGVSNIGKSEENVINYIKVVVIPNTNNIISIYPTLNIEEKYTYTLNCDYDKLFKRDKKEKTMSRIDRFNKKYNR